MLGFNIQAEDTIKYLKALSDVSMGDSQRFNSLTLAFPKCLLLVNLWDKT